MRRDEKQRDSSQRFLIEFKHETDDSHVPVAGQQLQLFGGRAHVVGALTGDQTGCRALWTRLVWEV